MNRYFRLLAGYNLKANTAMYSIVGALPEEKRGRDVGSYFHSIEGILNHIYDADLEWLKRIRAGFPQLASLHDAALDVEIKTFVERVFPDFPSLEKGRRHLDELFVRFADELTEATLEHVLEYRNSKGEPQRFLLWAALIHVFNHQTHHRGQIAEVLDEMEVANDYSNVNRYIGAPPHLT